MQGSQIVRVPGRSICAVLEKKPNKSRFMRAVMKAVQGSLPVLVLGRRICAMVEKEPSNF
jgi:hypothetical protein